MGNSRTRRAGAGLSVSAGASPAMQPVVRRPPAKRCAPLVPWPSLAPAVGNSRGCAEQFAHAPSRRRAVCVGGRVTRDAACGAATARKAVRPVGSLAHPRTCGGQFARLRRASRAPCSCLGSASHARGLFRVRASVSRGSNWASVSSGPRLVCVCPWLGDAVFLYFIKRPQACKAAPPITDCTAFLVYINFMDPVPSLVVCGKGLSFRSGFPHFQPSFPQLLTEFFTACPPSIFENYVNLQQYNAYKREERGKALFFVNSF